MDAYLKCFNITYEDTFNDKLDVSDNVVEYLVFNGDIICKKTENFITTDELCFMRYIVKVCLYIIKNNIESRLYFVNIMINIFKIYNIFNDDLARIISKLNVTEELKIVPKIIISQNFLNKIYINMSDNIELYCQSESEKKKYSHYLSIVNILETYKFSSEYHILFISSLLNNSNKYKDGTQFAADNIYYLIQSIIYSNMQIPIISALFSSGIETNDIKYINQPLLPYSNIIDITINDNSVINFILKEDIYIDNYNLFFSFCLYSFDNILNLIEIIIINCPYVLLMTDINGNTPLFYCCYNKHNAIGLLTLLIKYKANINHYNNNGNNALMEYIKNNIIDNIIFTSSSRDNIELRKNKLFFDFNILKLFIENGLNIEHKNNTKENLLSLAIYIDIYNNKYIYDYHEDIPYDYRFNTVFEYLIINKANIKSHKFIMTRLYYEYIKYLNTNLFLHNKEFFYVNEFYIKFEKIIILRLIKIMLYFKVMFPQHIIKDKLFNTLYVEIYK